jgi:hypothetical protein
VRCSTHVQLYSNAEKLVISARVRSNHWLLECLRSGVCEGHFLFSSFAVNAVSFPVCNEDFPVSIVGNSSKEASCLNGFGATGEGVWTEIPCIFPDIGEVQSARRVRCSLAAQPPSRGFSVSLLNLTRTPGRSPELRHQMAVVLFHSTPESAFPRTKAASLPFYLFWAFTGVTLAKEQMVPTICLAS